MEGRNDKRSIVHTLLEFLKQGLLYPFRMISTRRNISKEDVDAIDSESGKIIELDGKAVAVYKDKQGNITKLSPTCTHLRCLVQWDKQNSEWVCPCHKSRFSPGGEVISGPAKNDLAQISDSSEKEYIVKITAIEDVTHDVKRFVVEKPKGYTFTPGQATEISINKDGWREKKRPFTFTSLNKNQTLEFTIKKYPDHNGVTEQLHKLKAMDSLIIGEPFGTIQYNGKGVFIAGGAGVTPFIAILRKLHADNNLAGNKLIFSNKTKKDIILEQEFRSMFENHPKDLLFVLTRQNHQNYLNGRIDREMLKEHIVDFNQQFYVCGPPQFVEAIKGHLDTLGAKTQDIVFEGKES